MTDTDIQALKLNLTLIASNWSELIDFLNYLECLSEVKADRNRRHQGILLNVTRYR